MEQITRTKDTFPNPLQLTLGQGQVEVRFTEMDDEGTPGIMFRDTGVAHPIGDLCPHIETPYTPQAGELYLAIETIEAAVVVQDVLTAVMRRLCGFHDSETSGEDK